MKTFVGHALVLVSLAGCAGTPIESGPAAAPAPSAARSTPAASALSLDGRSYEVMLEIPDGPPVNDTLVFDHGRFESTACTSLGFPEWSDYDARASGEGISFHVVAKHPKGTTMDWSGSIQGDSVDGTAHRTMNGKTDVLRFKGARRS